MTAIEFQAKNINSCITLLYTYIDREIERERTGQFDLSKLANGFTLQACVPLVDMLLLLVTLSNKM